jgi:hypothetical protein
MSDQNETDLLANPPLTGTDAATLVADDSEIILDHATVDRLSDEDLSAYMENPTGFATEYLAKHGANGTSGTGTKVDQTGNSGQTGSTGTEPPPERPGTSQIPAKKDTAEGAGVDGQAAGETTGTVPPGTAGGTADGGTAAEDEDVVIDNPFRDQGIPDIWLIDPKTGNPYENGMILGKYRTPDAAFTGVVEQQKLIGRKGLSQPEAAEPEYQPQGFIAPVSIDDNTKAQLTQYAVGQALSDYQDEFLKMGLDSGEYLTDLDALKTASESLYLAVKQSAQRHYQDGAEYVTEYMRTAQVREELQDRAAEDGFNLFVDNFVAKTGAEPNDSDLGVLNDAYNGVLTGIMRYDQQVQQAQQSNPNVNVYEDPRVRQFYNQWFRTVKGVHVLDPQKVVAGALVANDALLEAAIRYSAVSAHQNALKAEAAAAPAPPITAASKAPDGATGGQMVMPSWEEANAPDYLEKLVIAYGDEDKAMQMFDRVFEEFDRQFKQRTISDKGNY